MKILLIEDNINLSKAIAHVLREEKFEVFLSSNGVDAESFWKEHRLNIDLVILDIQLPKKNGFDICQSIRGEKIDTPILMLTAKGLLEDKIRGFKAGADDYLIKPFAVEELLVRINALLRRSAPLDNDDILITKDIFLSKNSKTATKNKKIIALTAKEFEILTFLVRHKNKTISQQNIFDACFDFAKDQKSNIIAVHIKNLRKKLFYGKDEKIIKTIRGMGYRLEIE